MKYELLMECRGGTRHAFKTVLIIVLPDGTYKLHKTCAHCGSDKFPIWDKRGRILRSPVYKHSKEYRAFLDEHTPEEARAAILNSDIRKVEAPHAKAHTRLRLLPGAKGKRRRHQGNASLQKAR